jgi:hypothetical protein
LGRDPIEFWALANRYTYVLGEPTRYVDPSGLAPWLLPWESKASWNPKKTWRLWFGHSPSQHYTGLWTGDTNTRPNEFVDAVANSGGMRNSAFLYDFVLGEGPTNRKYGPGDPDLEDFRTSPGVNALRDRFYRGGCKSFNNGGYGTGIAGWETGPQWPGHWDNTAMQVGGFWGASVINNGDGTATFTVPNTAGLHSFSYHSLNDRSGAGMFQNIDQIFQWTEPIISPQNRPRR